jgi:hypothetical protein
VALVNCIVNGDLQSESRGLCILQRVMENWRYGEAAAPAASS